eukprot:m.55813 g.55813  ORF g.55813 m.55813 type:complete len:1063 (-) comp11522_c0_seq2:275-3463(-)
MPGSRTDSLTHTRSTHPHMVPGAETTSMSRKREELQKLEQAIQAEWEATKAFEVAAPEGGDGEKYFVTFPYPYMNGRLHLGHVFTLSKCEFAAGYQRLKGKTVLFPFGFHATGMPIAACADKLKNEMAQFGNPPVFPVDAEEQTTVQQKAKIAAKTGGLKYQWSIMQKMGIPDQEIPNFADPLYWLKYFPPHAVTDLKKFGLKVDWRRSFITTDVNPYYDAFVRWQMNVLKNLGFIKFGKRHCIFSPKDGQPCMDHDRSSGEGVGPQEYVGIKMKVIELPECLKACEGSDVFFVAATLRPETMYGQTNCWVGPDIEYIAWRTASGDVYVTSPRAARNMSFQGLTTEEGKVEELARFMGADVMGVKLSAPLTPNPVVYVLPMMTVKASKGTGVVTSVPSDAPADYIALEDLKKKEKLREKFGITDEMVMPFELIPIIDCPGLGTLAGQAACEKYKINSQNDAKKLEDAKEEVYKKGFYEGTMVIGECKGEPVQDAKPKIQDKLLAEGLAFTYQEPEKKIVSRSGDECVVALADQWFLNYGEEGWKAKAVAGLAKMELFDPKTKDAFTRALDWLHQHACSRTYGLGTRLPWDSQWLVESLSDSTIYMAYYTISHLLQGGKLDGKNDDGTPSSPLGITFEQCDDAFFDYVFLGKDDAPVKVPKDKLEILRREFNFFYPLDLRVSGNDLIQNHLTYCLYNHVGIFKEEHWPQAFRANGHLLLNSEKMSKSTGNFMTLSEALDAYGTDATRLALSNSGDGVEDGNFETDACNALVLRLFTELEWTEETLKNLGTFRTGNMDTLADTIFLNEINNAIVVSEAAYEDMRFRDAVIAGYFDLQNARDRYRKVCITSESNIHRDLIAHFITVQALILSPICPHVCEKIWKMLGNTTSILNASWPTAQPVDQVLFQTGNYLAEVEADLRKRLDKAKSGKKKKDVTCAKLYVAASYPPWQEETLKYMNSQFDPATKSLPENKQMFQDLSGNDTIKPFKKFLMPFVAMKKAEAEAKGAAALALTVAFDEMAVLSGQAEYLQKELGTPVAVLDSKELPAKLANNSRPGTPVIVLE